MAVIMVGPGTVVAPFRAFLQDRLVRGASGPAYICGDAKRMAADVEKAPLAGEGGMDEAGGKAYVAAMKRDARYQADVY